MTNAYSVAVLPGDAIGPEIMAQAVRVFDLLQKKRDVSFELITAPFGAHAYFDEGRAFPDATKAICDQADAILKGPVGLSHEESQKIPVEEQPERGAILPLRARYNTFANFRPITLSREMAHFSPLKPEIIRDGIDILLIRELVGGLYFGRKERGVNEDGQRYVHETLEYTEEQVRQVLVVAFEQARKRDKRLQNTPIIACSGAQVYCTKTRSDIYDTRLPRSFVEQLYEICNQHRCIASATVDAHTWLKIDQEPTAEHLSEELRWVIKLPEQESLPRIATVQGTSTIALVRELQQRDYADRVNIFDSIGPSGRTVITITARDADKGVALQKACEHLQINHNCVLAFGDADNDIAMFRMAGQSVAMGQASDDVKRAATHVTSDHGEDGVAEFIEQNLLRTL